MGAPQGRLIPIAQGAQINEQFRVVQRPRQQAQGQMLGGMPQGALPGFVSPSATIGGAQLVNPQLQTQIKSQEIVGTIPAQAAQKRALGTVELQQKLMEQKELLPGKVDEKRALEALDLIPKEQALRFVGAADVYNLSTDIMNDLEKRGKSLMTAPIFNRELMKKVNSLKNTILNLKSGQAVTPQEFDRLMGEVPGIADEIIDGITSGQPTKTIIKNLDYIAKRAEAMGTVGGERDRVYYDNALKALSNPNRAKNPYKSEEGFGIFEVVENGTTRRFKANSATDIKILESFGGVKIK